MDRNLRGFARPAQAVQVVERDVRSQGAEEQVGLNTIDCQAVLGVCDVSHCRGVIGLCLSCTMVLRHCLLASRGVSTVRT